MKALTAAEMREVDRLTAERGHVQSLQLMECAGASVAAVIGDRIIRIGLPQPPHASILCGKGNNGGDGFVVARHLHKAGTHVRVFLFARPEELRGDAATNYHRWKELGGAVHLIPDEKTWEAVLPEIGGVELIVDALLGTGLRGPATGLISRAIEDLNRHSRNATRANPALIVAVDTPSGLPSDGEGATGPVLYAHVTVTFTAPKIGQLDSTQAVCCGQLLVRSIGSPQPLIEEAGHGNLRWAGPEEFASLPLVRSADSNKGNFGHILLVAGSLGKSGAAIMGGLAALRAGAGLVTIATPEPAVSIVASAHPEYMTEPLCATPAGTVARKSLEQEHFSKLLEGKACLAIGPGLGTHPETQEFIRDAVREATAPVVLDADGLNAFAGRGELLRGRTGKFLVVTPHPGEMARLLGVTTKAVQADRVNIALEAARCWNAHIILKGFHSLIASPAGALFVNTTGNAGLAKGGTGDVLTGILAALTGQFGTDDWLRVLALGVYLHGAAADALVNGGDTSGLLASEVAQAVPRAREELLRELRRRG